MALENYFPHCLSEDEIHAHVNLRERVDLPLLAQRLEKLTGIFLSERVHSYFREDPVSPFTLAPYDILRLEGTSVAMDIADFSQGVVQLMDAMQRGFKLEKELSILLQGAHQMLESVYLHSPVTTLQHYFYYAQYFHHASLVYMLDPSATTLRYQRTALQIYNEALQSYARERELRQGEEEDEDLLQQRSHSQLVLHKGILLCEMEAEEEAVSLFYQIRGASEDGDELLMRQLELYKSQLVRVNSQEHAMRISSLAVAIGRAIVDPCHAEACMLAAQVRFFSFFLYCISVICYLCLLISPSSGYLGRPSLLVHGSERGHVGGEVQRLPRARHQYCSTPSPGDHCLRCNSYHF